MIEYIIGLLATIPSAYDDYIDYYVDDYNWIPYIPFILYNIFKYKDVFISATMFIDYFIYIVLLISYIIMRYKNILLGEADMILYFVLIFYEPIINLNLIIPDYIIIILTLNIIGLFYGLYKKIRYNDDKIPLVFMTPFAIITLYLLNYILTFI